MKLTALLLVGAGGFLGAITRYLVGTGVSHRWGAAWPYGTFIINITGCFAIAFFLTLVSERIVISENWRFFFPTGFVGAYTTFSTFEYETLRLVEDGAFLRAFSYVVSSVIVGFAAVLLASWLARRL